MDKVSSIQDRVIGIIAEQLGISKDTIKLEHRFVEDLGADSLETLNIVMELGEEFDVPVPDDIYDKALTVQQTIDFINDLIAKPQAA